MGFFVYIEVPKELEAIDLGEFEGHWPINGPVLHSEDIHHGGDVILWGTNGYIDCIEMYAFGEYFHETVIAFELT